MRRIIILGLFIFVSLGIGAQLSYQLSNKFWRLRQAEIGGRQYNFGGSANAPTLQFSGGSIRGNGGCNAYHTKFTINGTVLSVERIMSTKMSCNDLSLEESEFFSTLAQSHRIEYTEGSNEFRLVNYNNDILVFYAQFERAAGSYSPPPVRRTYHEPVERVSRHEREKPALSKKQLDRKKLLERKLNKKKLTKAERRELIVLQSKEKKAKISKTKRSKRETVRAKKSKKSTSRKEKLSKKSSKKSSGKTRTSKAKTKKKRR